MSATDELGPWWARRPDRLRWELANFADAGLPAHWDGQAIHTQITLSDGRTVEAIVTFPFEYPRIHPDVHVRDGLLGPPHEVHGQLCLLDRPGSQWHPGRSAAQLVVENAGKLLEDALIGGPDAVARGEEQVPLLSSRLFAITHTLVVFVPDPFWTAAIEESSGWFALAGERERRLLEAVIGVGQADSELKKRVGCEHGLQFGRWVALDHAPPGRQFARSLLRIALAAEPRLLEPLQAEQPIHPQWVALTYLEEGPYRGQTRRAYTFIELALAPGSPGEGRIAETQALSLAERSLRLPELRGLEEASIILLGVGSLGSKVAIELAKAGAGKLILCDHDTYDANNAVRHELPVRAAGCLKVGAMANACREANPFCEVVAEHEAFGHDQASAEKLLERLQSAHLVIETTGDRQLTRIAARYCRLAGVPLLTASLTRGSRGGDMLLLTPDMCFDCFLLAQAEGRIPAPAEGEQAIVLPVGCADPAFSGAGFDASELSSIVARTAVRATALTDYPALDHNWAVLNFVAEPHHTQGEFAPDPACRHE